MKKGRKLPPGDGHSKAKRPAKQERTARISDEDWEDIRRAAKALALSAGDYFVDLHRRRGTAKGTSPSAVAVKSALEMRMTQLTRAIMQQKALSDDVFEALLEIQHLMQQIIETE